MFRIYTLLFLVIPLFLSGQATDGFSEKSFGIGLVPQYAVTNGTRIDFDIRLPGKNQWLVIGPQFYVVTENSNLWNFNEMTGFGVDLQHRFFLKNDPKPAGAYLAYGPVVQFFSVKDEGLAAYDFQEGNVSYIGLNEEMIRTKIRKVGGNLVFGYQLVPNQSFYFDFYPGTGIRFSYDNRKSGLHSYYNEWWGDLGYSGTLLVAGFRFGIFM